MEYTRFTNVEITGELKVAPGGSLALPVATTEKYGVVRMAAKVSEAAGSTVTAAEFKALLDALKNAGIMDKSV